jgi:hypothetical protein
VKQIHSDHKDYEFHADCALTPSYRARSSGRIVVCPQNGMQALGNVGYFIAKRRQSAYGQIIGAKLWSGSVQRA